MKNIYPLLACLLFLNHLFSQTTYSKEVEEQIKQVENNLAGRIKVNGKGYNILDRMAFYKIKGLSIAVVNNYKVVWAKGYGWADEKEKRPVAFNIPRADSVLGLNYGPNDTRTMGGQFSCFPTNKGKMYGLPEFWDASVFLQPDQVDMVLGKNENGLVSAFAKNYNNGGKFVQLYVNPDIPVNLDAIVKLAEWKLE